MNVSFIFWHAFLTLLLTAGLDGTDEHKKPADKGKKVVELRDDDNIIDVNSQQFRDIVQQTVSDFLRSATHSSSSAPGLSPKVPKFVQQQQQPHQDQAVHQQQQLLVPVSFDGQNKEAVDTSSTAAHLSKRKHSQGVGAKSKQKQKLRPVKVEEEQHIGDAQIMGMELRIAAEKAMQKLDNTNLEKHVYRMLEVSLLALNFHSVDLELMKIVYENRKEIDKKLEKCLKAMNAEKVAKRLKDRLFGDKVPRENQSFANLLHQIGAQTVNVWGMDPFRSAQENVPNAHRATLHGALLFFYARLFTKLSTLLEAPFDDGHAMIGQNKPEISRREAQVIWMSAARGIIVKELSNKFELQFNMMIKLDELETIADQISLALLAIELTLLPIAAAPSDELSSAKFSHYLDYIKQNNLACFIVANKGGLNMAQIPASISANRESNPGLAITFLRLFIETIGQHNGQNGNILRQIVDIYHKIYSNLINFMRASDTEQLIKTYKDLIKSQPSDAVQSNIKLIQEMFEFVYDFLEKSVVQLEQFMQMHDDAVGGGENAELIKRNFMGKHCPQFLAQF